MLIGSYMDESFDMKSGIFSVGGLLGRGVAFFELERRWEKLCRRPDINVAYFKASECERGSKQFARFVATPEKPTPAEQLKLGSISLEFLHTIATGSFDKSYLIAAGIGIVQDDFYDVTRKDPRARAILGNSPYRLAYDFAMIQAAWAMKELGKEYIVSFVCDENEEHGQLAHEAFRRLRDQNPSASQYMGTYNTADDKICLPLQAADAVV